MAGRRPKTSRLRRGDSDVESEPFQPRFQRSRRDGTGPCPDARAERRGLREALLTLGADCARLDRHRDELLEAGNLAGYRWSRLLDLEAQAENHPELRNEARRERAELESFDPDDEEVVEEEVTVGGITRLVVPHVWNWAWGRSSPGPFHTSIKP